MLAALARPERVARLCVVDIAPVHYPMGANAGILAALRSVRARGSTSLTRWAATCPASRSVATSAYSAAARTTTSSSEVQSLKPHLVSPATGLA